MPLTSSSVIRRGIRACNGASLILSKEICMLGAILRRSYDLYMGNVLYQVYLAPRNLFLHMLYFSMPMPMFSMCICYFLFTNHSHD